MTASGEGHVRWWNVGDGSRMGDDIKVEGWITGADTTSDGSRLALAWGDRVRIGQLLANLVGNGLKYNKSEHPTVEVFVEPTGTDGGEFATLAVRDNGIGIDPKFHLKIFQIFRRLHTRDEYEGTGAGLAICQKIVQAHGGRLWVESAPGAGATFRLTLPLRCPSSAPRAEPLHAP